MMNFDTMTLEEVNNILALAQKRKEALREEQITAAIDDFIRAVKALRDLDVRITVEDYDCLVDVSPDSDFRFEPIIKNY